MMKRSKPRRLELGSYSSGTMRPEDLIPNFLAAADRLRLSRVDRKTVTSWRMNFEDDNYTNEIGGLSELINDLMDLLGNYTPDYCYFGAHPGDGADYGVWVVEDLFSDTHQGSYDGCCYRSDMTPYEMRSAGKYGHANGIQYSESDRQSYRNQYREAFKTYTHWLYVNDHGNCTLYRRSGNHFVEVWSIV